MKRQRAGRFARPGIDRNPGSGTFRPAMNPISRRTCLQRLALTLPAASALPLLSAGRVGAAEVPVPDDKELAAIAGIARAFMEKFEVPGFSVAFAHLGKPAYEAAFGMADEGAGEALATDHRFRIASISKPVTAVAVFALVEQGKLKLDDKVFGPAGKLDAGAAGKLPADLAAITVHHLLTHTSGGWQNDRDDPMFRHPELAHDDLIARTLRDQPLKKPPGEHYAYSNFGYCLLGRLIEQVSGKSYPDFVQEQVLGGCRIESMKIAGNTLADRLPREVVYHGRNGENPYRMNVRRMDAHGGWLATPRDVVKFLVRCDGSAQPSDLLQEDSVKTMMSATKANPAYASGWAVNATPNRWHGGSLPGTATIAVQTASGLCWAGFANARNKDIAGALDRVMWDLAKAVPKWAA
jgi:CubicO group peptidase (beta-lactamase class C family)